MEVSLKQLSMKEQAALIKLDILLRAEDEIKEDQVNTATLIRFLRAHNFSAEAAQRAILDHLTWSSKLSKEFMTNTITAKGAEFSKQFHVHFYGNDTKGRPICLIRPNEFNPDNFLSKFTVDEVIILMSTSINRLINDVFPAYSEKYKRTIYSVVCVIDIKNLPVSKIITNKDLLDFAQKLSGVFQSNFPEIMHKFIIVNASSFFWALYHIVSLFVSKKTAEKGTVLSTDYLSELVKHAPLDQWPHSLGGSCPYEEDKYPNCF